MKGLTRKTISLWLDCSSTNRIGGRTVKAIGLTLPNGNKYVLPFIDIPKGVRKGIVVYASRRLIFEWYSLDNSGTMLLAFFCDGIERTWAGSV